MGVPFARLSTMRVLIVDDDPDLTDVFAMLIQAEGHEVVTANSGRDAVALAAASHFDVVLLDVMMPRMGGGEVIQRLRELPRPPGAVVAVTGYQLSEAAARAAGFRTCFIKPVAGPELLALLSQLAGEAG